MIWHTFRQIILIKTNKYYFSSKHKKNWNLLILVLFIDYTDPLLKYHIESLIAEYEQEWIISSIYLQTNTKLNIETIIYQSQNQLKLFEKCKSNIFKLIFLFYFSMSTFKFNKLFIWYNTFSLSISNISSYNSFTNAYSTYVYINDNK